MTLCHKRFLILALACFASIAKASPSLAKVAKVARERPPERSQSSVPKNAKKQTPISAEELFRRFSPAVVKIELKQQGIPISVGAGFFVSSDGILVTNHHVIRAALASSSVTAEFSLNDGRKIRDFKVASCGDSRNIDLCLLRLNVRPKSHFPLRAHRPSPGEVAYVIGHPQNLDFSISNGIVSAVRSSSTGINEVQISAAISPGNSGGPIFNDRAELIGVATKYLATGQNLNFGILTSEIMAYRKVHSRFVAKTEASARMTARIRETMRQRYMMEVEPALRQALKSAGSEKVTGKPTDKLNNLKEIPFELGDKTIRLRLPKIFETCAKTPMAPRPADATLHACFALGEAVAFSIQHYKLDDKGALLRRTGTQLLSARPLGIVDALAQEGTWAEKSKALTSSQRSSFESKPTPARCQKLPDRAPHSRTMMFSQAPACRFTVSNDQEPGGYSVNLWVESGEDLYAIAVWMNDPALADYFSQIPLLAALTAEEVQENTVASTSLISEP